MPYITHEDRDRLRLEGLPETPGELNYVITELVSLYLIRYRGKIGYTALNEVDGVLGQVQAEFRRRIIAPYEDMKIEENGDVYDELINQMRFSRGA